MSIFPQASCKQEQREEEKRLCVTMKKLLGSLPARLVLGVLAGILVGLWAGGASAGGLGETVMQVILTVKNLLGSLISFCVPLIVIGFIAPSITRLKSNASRMLGLSLLLAYTSSVCAALLSAGSGLRPHPRHVHPVLC